VQAAPDPRGTEKLVAIKPEGNTSDMDTESADDGPALETAIEYTYDGNDNPAVTCEIPVFTTVTSTQTVTALVNEYELLAGSKSTVVLFTVTVLTIDGVLRVLGETE